MNRQQAQQCLDTYPDNSPFWDSSSGQDALEARDEFLLVASNTNKQRCAINAQLMRSAYTT